MAKALMLAAAVCCLASACDKFDDTDLWNAVNELREKVEALEKQVGDNVAALQSIVSLESVSSCEFDTENGKVIITLLDGKKIEIDRKVTGYPLVSVIQEADGRYYWAVCRDGKTEALVIDGVKVPVSVTPSFKLSEKNEWLVSVDGGKTWVSTGIVQEEESAVFFKDVKVEGDYMILTLADGTVVKVAVVGEAEFKLAADSLWFSRTSMTKSAMIQMNNVKSYTITEKPEGWKAYVEESYLYVTSPEDFEMNQEKGEVKLLALFSGGAQPEILTVPVLYEPAFSLSLNNASVVVEVSEHTGEDFTGYILKAWLEADYTPEKALQWLNGEGAQTIPYTGEGTYEISSLVEGYSPKENYVIIVSPYLPVSQVVQGTMSYEISDIQSVTAVGGNQWSFSDISFDYAHLNAMITDVTQFYGGFYELEVWNNYGMQSVLESFQYRGGPELCTNLIYDGPASGFPFNRTSPELLPSTEYVVWMLPYTKTGKYTSKDFIVNTFKTTGITKDASIPAPSAVVDEITLSGFKATVTPAVEAYKTYSAIRPVKVIPENETDAIVELMGFANYSQGRQPNTVSTVDYDSDTELCLMSVSVTEDGRFGEVLRQNVTPKELVFTDAISVSVTGIEYGIGDVTLSLDFKGNPSDITYFAEMFVFHTDQNLQRFMALGQLGGLNKVAVSSLEGGKLKLSQLVAGSQYTFYAVVSDADDKYSALCKYEFIPRVDVSYLLKGYPGYNYGKPTLSGRWIDATTYALNVDKPAECVKYWLFRGDPEYLSNDAWTDSDKILTNYFGNVTEHTESISGRQYQSMYKESRFYMVWLDTRDQYHGILEYNPYQ